MAYCPYPIIASPNTFNLLEDFVDTSYGTLHIVYSKPKGSIVSLFLHGVGGNWSSWTPLLKAAQSHNKTLGDIFLVDLPGFGQSENVRSDLDIQAVGEELLLIIKGYGWSKIRLIGHSMGGFLALDMTSRNHKEIISLVTISGAYFSIVDTVQHPLRTIRFHPATVRAYGSMWCLAKMGPIGTYVLQFIIFHKIRIHILKATVDHPQSMDESVLRSLIEGMRPQSFMKAAHNGKVYNTAIQWSKIDVPVTAIFGMGDSLVPALDADRLKQCIPHATITIVQNAKHFAHIEQPDFVLNYLID